METKPPRSSAVPSTAFPSDLVLPSQSHFSATELTLIQDYAIQARVRRRQRILKHEFELVGVLPKVLQEIELGPGIASRRSAGGLLLA